jgi:hypothetical protein
MNILLFILRYKVSALKKNIGYLLKFRNKVYINNHDNLYMIIEIIIHLIQPLPNVDPEWVIKTLGINVTYNLDAILTGFTLIRTYVFLRVLKYFNMYNVEDILTISHIDISSIYSFLYRSNIKLRPFITIFTIFLFFFVIWSILFICYERFDINGTYSYTWNVLWIIIVTITTSMYN